MNWWTVIEWLHGTGATIAIAAAPGLIGWVWNSLRRRKIEELARDVLAETEAFDQSIDAIPRPPTGDDYNVLHSIVMQLKHGVPHD